MLDNSMSDLINLSSSTTTSSSSRIRIGEMGNVAGVVGTVLSRRGIKVVCWLVEVIMIAGLFVEWQGGIFISFTIEVG